MQRGVNACLTGPAPRGEAGLPVAKKRKAPVQWSGRRMASPPVVEQADAPDGPSTIACLAVAGGGIEYTGGTGLRLRVIAPTPA